uniref:rhamnogalacturonan lyase n=1 Tax=Nocardiopsis salina TaxID=245836 RepID=UPI00187231AA|nr:rhamnogalacturonan lyase [Nocardiopsis salina]
MSVLLTAGATHAPTVRPEQDPHAQMEDLDRGLVAVESDEGVLLSWRLLGHEVSGQSENGMEGPDFEVFRDGESLGVVGDSTNFLDEDGSTEAAYSVARVDGEGPEGEASVWEDGFHDIGLQRPEGGTTPDGVEYEYSANDVSVGDVLGDGQYEFVVKWDPSNSKDNSHTGYTGNVFIDTYTLGGELLNRIDLGPNIRAGAHYTQFLVHDFDGDGRAELMFRTAPGTRTVELDENGEEAGSEYITMPEEDLEAGHSHGDDHRSSADDYYENLVERFEGWHAEPEVEAGQWPATIEEGLGEEPRYDYPLGEGEARELADFFIDEYAPDRNENNDLRGFEGFVVEGPEYLTVFDGQSGAELDTVRYEPERGDDGLRWGDYAMERIEPANRVDRFLAGVAHLDGEAPSAVFARGYYTRTAVVAYDFDGKRIQKRWSSDSGHVEMDNPFDDDGIHMRDAADPELGVLAGQGFHSLSVADVDGDGRQEIVYGSAVLDHDGSLLHSSCGESPAVDGDECVKFGHGDALHVGDFDPDRDGLEIWSVHEDSTAPYGYAMRDAETGEVLFGDFVGGDVGRGMVGDIDPDRAGVEAWYQMGPGEGEAGSYTADGEFLGEDVPGTNMSIRWSGDMTTQIVHGADTEDGSEPPRIEDWNEGTLLTAEGTLTNNDTKGTPSLVADVLGDWREELIVRTEDSSALRIFSSPEVTDLKVHTLMHDPQYRVGIAWQQTAYNQPTYPSFMLASGTDWSQVPEPQIHYPDR